MITIDPNKCTACSVCGHECPRHIPVTSEINGSKTTMVSEERISLCMSCGHCEAICPTGAIHVDTLDTEDFMPLEDPRITPDQIKNFMKQRRSVRRYKDKSVPRDTLELIVDSAGYAPTGNANMSTGVIIIDRESILKEISDIAYTFYENFDKTLRNPVARWMIKRQIKEQMVHTVIHFLMPGMRWYIKWYKEGKGNEILRDCKALMLFTSPKMEVTAHENCLLAAYQASYMAQSLGVGSCLNDIMPPVCQRDKRIRERLQLPEDREVYASLTLGYPKYKYVRTIPRKVAEVRYV